MASSTYLLLGCATLALAGAEMATGVGPDEAPSIKGALAFAAIAVTLWPVVWTMFVWRSIRGQ